MWPFTRKPEKQLNSEEYERILKRSLDVESRLSRLELGADDLRDKVLRKIQKARTQQEDAPEGDQIIQVTGTRLFGGKH